MPRTCFLDGTPATTTLDDDDDDGVGSGESIESGNSGMCVFGVPRQLNISHTRHLCMGCLEMIILEASSDARFPS